MTSWLNRSPRGRVVALGILLAGAMALATLTRAWPAGAQISFGDLCKGATPDATLYIPQSFSGTQSKSSDSKIGGGAYFYKDSLCKYWVVDVKMATYSNDTYEVNVSGDAYDLPSSAGFGGTRPTNAEDCTRLSLGLRFYKKLSTASEFTLIGSGSGKGQWQNNTCTIAWNAGAQTSITAYPSATGWDTYRVAVQAKLRSSWQEVRVSVPSNAPPPK